MDNRLDTSEDDQATPEHGAGRAKHGGYTVKQPDRSGTEVLPDARTVVAGPDTAAKSGSDASQTAPTPGADGRARAGVWAALRESMRQHPVQTIVNGVGLALIVVALRRTRRH